MKKIGFLFMLVFLLVFTSACDSQNTQSPTFSICYSPEGFYNEEEFTQIIQDPERIAAGYVVLPNRYLAPSQLFPNDEIRYGWVETIRLFCGFLPPKDTAYSLYYYMQYKPAYEEMSLPDIMAEFLQESKEDWSFVARTESVTQLDYMLRSSMDETANKQMFTVAGTPIIYSFVKGRIAYIAFSYKGFYLTFSCYDNKEVIDWDAPTTSSFVNTMKNLTDPTKVEQELQRLKDVIDTHLENYPA